MLPGLPRNDTLDGRAGYPKGSCQGMLRLTSGVTSPNGDDLCRYQARLPVRLAAGQAARLRAGIVRIAPRHAFRVESRSAPIAAGQPFGIEPGAVPVTACQSSGPHGVGSVIGNRPNAQMGRITAWRVVAGMSDQQPRGDRPISLFVSEAMGRRASAVHPQVPIASDTAGPLPLPARIRRWPRYFGHQPLAGGDRAMLISTRGRAIVTRRALPVSGDAGVQRAVAAIAQRLQRGSIKVHRSLRFGAVAGAVSAAPGFLCAQLYPKASGA
jgi:hypothetical protein